MRSYGNRLEKADIPFAQKERFTHSLLTILNEKWNDISAPECAHDIQDLYRSYVNDPDPFREVKLESNDIALAMYGDLSRKVDESDDPFITALKLAIAGNIIDFAVNDSCDLDGTIDRVLRSELAVDHSLQLKQALERANRVLYIGDNAGEIVFDKLFIGQIAHPGLVYSVRGGPAINDATMEDADYTGMTSVARVISSGHASPTTDLSRSGEEFQRYFREADLIISKGQGNLEGLIGIPDRRIFFLLMAKCNVISEYLGIETGSFVVINPSLQSKKQ
ncbi:MAG: DUF89 family protein [Bacteroidales bacterium]|nr:DUF89 family protein [Bacteroidales bacterium]